MTIFLKKDIYWLSYFKYLSQTKKSFIYTFYLDSRIFKIQFFLSIVVNMILFSLQEVKVFVEDAKLTKGQFEH